MTAPPANQHHRAIEGFPLFAHLPETVPLLMTVRPRSPASSSAPAPSPAEDAPIDRAPRRKAKPARAWQRMLSGRRLDLLDPSPLDIEIEDIAHGLARVARWNGQTHGDNIFSVAQHSLLTEHLCRSENPGMDRTALLCALLHDAPEYVIGDMISPFKAVLGDDYKQVEARLLAAISIRFSLPSAWPKALVKSIKTADLASAHFEATHLAGFSAAEAQRFFGRAPHLDPAEEQDYLVPWTAQTAKARFLARFEELQP